MSLVLPQVNCDGHIAEVSGIAGRYTLHHASLARAIELKVCVVLRIGMYYVANLLKHVSTGGHLAI